MAITSEQRTLLRNWLQSNIHKAVHRWYYREGIKDEDGKPVYGVCTLINPRTGEPRTQRRRDWTGSPDPEAPDYNPSYGRGIRDFTGSSDEAAPDYNPNYGQFFRDPITYWGRTFTVRSHRSFDFGEVVFRTYRKAVKEGIDTNEDQVRTWLLNNRATLKTWAATNITGASPVTREEIEAEDPDAVSP